MYEYTYLQAYMRSHTCKDMHIDYTYIHGLKKNFTVTFL